MKTLVPMLCCLTAVAAAQPKQEATVMEALLHEVRELRMVVERSTITIPKLQMAIQKWHIQQARVDMLSDRLDQLRAVPPEDLKELESQVYRAMDTQSRRAAELRLGAAKNRVSQEQHLARQLQTEQGRLRDFQQEFQRLERSLDQQASASPLSGGR